MRPKPILMPPLCGTDFLFWLKGILGRKAFFYRNKVVLKMNYRDFQQNNASTATSEEIRGPVSIPNWKGPVFCPKPQRVGILIDNPMRPLRCYMSHKAEVFDSKAGAELLDIILKKEGFGAEQSGTQLVSSPPFFFGSPPSRTANPLIQDARFGDEKLTSLSASPISSPSRLSSPSSSAKKGGCIRMKFGHRPAAVRVEGFDCLNRDRQQSSIPAVA